MFVLIDSVENPVTAANSGLSRADQIIIVSMSSKKLTRFESGSQ